MKWKRYLRHRGLGPAVMALVLAVSLAACGGGGAANASSGGSRPQKGGTVTVGLDAESNNLLPGASQLALSGVIEDSVIFDPLMAVDSDGTFHPFLAQALTPNSDYTQWTLKLRPNVKFQDGTALDAQTLKTIFDNYLTAPGATTLSYLSYNGALDKMQVVNDLTVKYILPQTDAAFPWVLTQTPGQPFSVKAAQASGQDDGIKPVGTGPFMIKSRTIGAETVLVPNPYYWRKGHTHLSQLIFKPIPDETSRLQSFQSGSISAMITTTGSTMRQIKNMQSSGRATLETFTGDDTGGNVFNTAEAPFNDVRVRKALIEATDLPALVQLLDDVGFVKPATQYFNVDSPWYSKEAAAAYPKFNDAAAKQLLDSYRNDPNRSDGKPVGAPVSFTYQCQPDLSALMQAYQSQWDKVGFNMTIDSVEQAAMVSNVVGSPSTKPPYAGSFQAACWRFHGDPDPEKLASDFGPSDSVLNFTNYSNPALTTAIADLSSTANLAKRKQAAAQISMILAQQVPQQFLDTTLQGIGFGAGVHASKGITLPDGGTGRPIVGGAAIDWSSLSVSRSS